ncbi:hypothetical protein BGW39_011735 [Mortierella sp. 14UC]|nr:hypothetical protein BGW39_011735 [Mortierella sp. 14UC]
MSKPQETLPRSSIAEQHQLNFRAPSKYCHEYFHTNGHLNWNLKAFFVQAAGNTKDAINTKDEALELWRSNLTTIGDARFTPAYVKNHVRSLLRTSRIPVSQGTSAAVELTLEAKQRKRLADTGLGHMKVMLFVSDASYAGADTGYYLKS